MLTAKLWSSLATAVVVMLASGAVRAQCPQNLCDCVDNAANFALVAGPAKFGPGSYSDDGDLVVVGTDVSGSSCVASGSFRGRIDGDGALEEDLVARSVKGIAARFRSFKEDGDITPGFSVDGDIVTAGGSVRGEPGLDYDLFGSVILDANEPRVASCNQAVLDIQTASTSLAAPSAANERYDSYIVDENREIHATAGVYVVNIAGDLRVNNYKSLLGFSLGRALSIVTDADTEAVIINVGGSLIVADDAIITADFPEIMVINLTTPKSKVIIGKRATVEVPILAPGSGVLARAEASTANIWSTRKMNVQGATITNVMECDVTEIPAKTVFVSSEEYDGATLAGLGGADALCQELASDAFLAGTYKAWLSDSVNSAASRMSHALVPYVLVDGTTQVAKDWTDLTDGALLHAIDHDEDGFALDPFVDNLQVWTATFANGSFNGPSCSAWSSASDEQEGTIGFADEATSAWTDDDTTFCDDLARLYCIQQ